MTNCYALHDRERGDLTSFWAIFNNLHIITDKEMFENMQYYMEYCQNNEYTTPQDWIKNHKHF